MRITIVPCKECHEYPCTCEEKETDVEENNTKDEGDDINDNQD